MTLKTLQDLFHHELKDLYSAEVQILKALPKMIDAATDKELQKALSDHLKQSRTHKQRLERVCKSQKCDPTGHKCKGIEGIIKEGEDLLKEKDVPSDVLDAAIIASAQRVEHYEMAGYGTARTYAEKLGDLETADHLQTTLDEEGEADRLLSRLAERGINAEAAAE
jgi:ferritin-like metal-binding protein YciE